MCILAVIALSTERWCAHYTVNKHQKAVYAAKGKLKKIKLEASDSSTKRKSRALFIA